jgi:hypothetical protein
MSTSFFLDRKSSLNHLDHGIIFGRLKPIQEATASLLLKVEITHDIMDI